MIGPEMDDMKPGDDIKKEEEYWHDVGLVYGQGQNSPDSANSSHIHIKEEMEDSATDASFSDDSSDESITNEDKKWLSDRDVDGSVRSANLCESVCKKREHSSTISRHSRVNEDIFCDNDINSMIAIKPESSVSPPYDYSSNMMLQIRKVSESSAHVGMPLDNFEMDRATVTRLIKIEPQPPTNQSSSSNTTSNMRNTKCLRKKRPFKCSHCSKRYGLSAVLFAHLTKEHQEESTHKCPICNQVYKYSTYLKYHFKTCNGPQKAPKKTQCKCPTCGKLFKCEKEFQKHQKSHEKQRPPNKQQSAKNQHKCFLCEKECRHFGDLARHLRTHRESDKKDEKQFKCTECSQCFLSQYALDRHTIKTHTKKPVPECTICKRTFSSNSSLSSHRRLHLDERPFQCSTCGKCFRAIQTLTIHQRSHSGERPHVCTTCNKRFTTGHILKRHIRTHTGEKPYVCPTCGQGFIQSYNLKVHKRSHTGEKPFTCSTCSKAFHTKHVLKEHQRLHTGERPHVCTTCGKAFRTGTLVWLHMKTHTGAKPYVCDTCGRAFSAKHNLQQHMRSHTGE